MTQLKHKNETRPQDNVNNLVNTLNTKAEKAPITLLESREGKTQKGTADGYANNILGRTFTDVIKQNLKLVTTSPYYDIANAKH